MHSKPKHRHGSLFSRGGAQERRAVSLRGPDEPKDLVDYVADHAAAIGYANVYPSGNRVRIVGIKATESSPAVEATIETIRQRQYPLSRYLYWYLAGKPKGKLKDFCEWVLSSEGQLVVESVGFEPLPAAERLAGLRKLDPTFVAAKR